MAKRYGRNRRRKDREFVSGYFEAMNKIQGEIFSGIEVHVSSGNDIPIGIRESAKAIRRGQGNSCKRFSKMKEPGEFKIIRSKGNVSFEGEIYLGMKNNDGR